MNGFKAQGATKPTAMGSLLQAATYGATVPVIYGQTQSPLLAIWAANLRQGTSNKKLKNFIAKLKGNEGYEENVDFLLGHNPIMGVLQFMVNGGLYPLNFTSHTFTGIFTNVGTVLTIPDSNFYMVIAVTTPVAYSFAVDDYGGQGPQTLSGTYDVPLWNDFEVGPDPTGNSGYRNIPYVYTWNPADGPNVTINGAAFSSVTVYYAQLTSATSNQPPATKLRLAFESQLGSGTEYADAPAPFDAQQIIYPQFAGCGSSDIDLGVAGAIPQLQPEVRGKWGIYPSGDGDFVDMIEDIFKSGLAQAAIGATSAFTQMERGLSSYDMPGCVQKKQLQGLFYGGGGAYNLPNMAGNFLVVIWTVGNPDTSTLGISSTNGETWTPVFGTGLGYQVWYAAAIGGGINTVTGTGGAGASVFTLLEIQGVDTFDSVSIGSVPSGNATITTTNQQNFAEYMLAISVTGFASGNLLNAAPDLALWDTIIGPPPELSGTLLGLQIAQERVVYAPATYSIENNFVNPNIPGSMAILAFKATQPANYPKPLGDFIDLPSLEIVRQQCRANGLWGSLSMSSQSAASDWLKSLYSAANAAPVFLGNKLYSIPYSEVSAAGNGALYTAPTASGPLANLNANNGDFTTTPELQTGSRINLPNVLQLQIISREANYTQVVVAQPESASIALYGVRKADPVVNNAIQDTSVALLILGIMVRRNQYGGDTYTFSLNAKWSLLAPMDLVTLTDSLTGILNVPGRLTSISEQDDASFQCEAEPFVYGMCSPTPFVPSPTSPTVNPAPVTNSAGNVNTPIIFEPTPQLYGNANQGQLWIVLSSGNSEYGGSQVYVSTDGGSSYNPLGNPVSGSAVTGVSTADWPAATDPDTTHNLALDLTESDGTLLSYAVSDENNFVYPCYIAGGGQPIPYELMTYAVATLTAANKYTLMATGGGTNQLRRGVFGAPQPAVGFDHPSGSRFAFLNPSGIGILKVAMQPTWIGVALYFKVLSFNTFGGAVQSLADVSAYTYTPLGTSGQGVNLSLVNGA